MFDPATETASHYVHDPDDPNSISDNDIRVMYIDRDGMLWLGTRHGGLNRFDPATSARTQEGSSVLIGTSNEPPVMAFCLASMAETASGEMPSATKWSSLPPCFMKENSV